LPWVIAWGNQVYIGFGLVGEDELPYSYSCVEANVSLIR